MGRSRKPHEHAATSPRRGGRTSPQESAAGKREREPAEIAMRLLSKLLSYSRGAMVLATLAGLAAGAARAGLLFLINHLLHRNGPGVSGLLWPFLALALVVPLTSVGSTYLLLRLGEQAPASPPLVPP